MTVLKRLLGYPLLGIGGLFVMAMILAPLSALSSEQDKQVTKLGGLVLGLPLSAAGGSLVLSAQNQERRQAAFNREQARLRQVLYRLLQAKSGQVTLVQFAIAANVSADEARNYIDSQAAAFGANFGVTEAGSVVYQFPIS
ncbi:MAG: hypothetical protein AAFQ63_05455 [Cyanobacteria bacterium J06621_11]